MPIIQTLASGSARGFGQLGFSKTIVTGGTLTSDSTYYYRTFTANGTLTIAGGPIVIEYMLVGGGGAGGERSANYHFTGGGGGGAAIRSAVSLSNATSIGIGSYSVVVGAGGAIGSSGVASTFNSVTAPGGGRGAGVPNPSATGGGGGGGSISGSTYGSGYTLGGGGSPASSTGAKGGNSSGSWWNGSSYEQSAGGGGGGTYTGSSAGDGVAALGTNTGGAGGYGWVCPLPSANWYSVTGVGDSQFGFTYFGGGGAGGSAVNYVTNGNGGVGGGGIGAANTAAAAGTVNTGGGGGGGGYSGVSKAGGSGSLTIRYLKTAV